MEALAAWVAALLAAGVLLWEMHRVRLDRRAQLTAAYLQRFWEIDDDLLITEKGSKEHNQHRHRYLKLCEDEFEAARAGLLDLRLWREWHDWLTDSRMHPRIVEDLDAVDPNSQRFEHLRSCLDGAPGGHLWKHCQAWADARPRRVWSRFSPG